MQSITLDRIKTATTTQVNLRSPNPERGIARAFQQVKTTLRHQSESAARTQSLQTLIHTSWLQDELHQQTQKLHSCEAQMHNLILRNADGILVIDEQGVIQFANNSAEALLQYQMDELLGQEFFGNLVVQRHANEISTEVIHAEPSTPSPNPHILQTQVEIRRPDGAVAIAEMRLVETEWEGSRAYLASLREITKRWRIESALRRSEQQLREKAAQLEQTLQELQATQAQLIQTEKMSSLGQLVAGLAHEINNPINFISGNLNYLEQYIDSLLTYLGLYQQYYPDPVPVITAAATELDLDFLITDLQKIFASMKMGTERVRNLVLALRNFSRLDESAQKIVDIHEGLESTLLLLKNRLQGNPSRPEIQVLRDYGSLPKVECYAGQLNQVFMNLLNNAIDALDEAQLAKAATTPDFQPTIWIRTHLSSSHTIQVSITDNGIGITEETQRHLFDPFFTTKSVGQGIGLGLSISYQIIVQRHGETIQCHSQPHQKTEFCLEIPVYQQLHFKD